MKPTIFFSTGEPSGDIHTARLIEALHNRNPDLEFRGFGGPEMQSAGCKIDFDLTQLAVMGLVEVIPKISEFYRVANQAKDIFRKGNIDAVLLSDFPGFNWHIAARAKKFGIPVYYYLPPQLWAWAPWRIRKVRRNVDHVLCVLPFEYQWYRERGVQATYVGHPFFDAVREQELSNPVLAKFQSQRDSGERLVAVLPGSRNGEVADNWPLQLEAIRRLSREHPDARFLVACFRDRHCLSCREQLTEEDQRLPIDFYVGKTSEIIEAAACAIMVSGSVSLELMARKTPAVVLYRIGRVFHTLASRLVQVDSITLPNLIAEEKLFPETISVGDPEPSINEIVHATSNLLNDSGLLEHRQQRLTELCEQYAKPGASGRTAEAILQLMQSTSGSKEKIAA